MPSEPARSPAPWHVSPQASHAPSSIAPHGSWPCPLHPVELACRAIDHLPWALWSSGQTRTGEAAGSSPGPQRWGHTATLELAWVHRSTSPVCLQTEYVAAESDSGILFFKSWVKKREHFNKWFDFCLSVKYPLFSKNTKNSPKVINEI